jgi:predicted TIM-barrel fold metal-dependent hydrolase
VILADGEKRSGGKQQSTTEARMADFRIIDADGHVQEADAPWQDLVEPQFRHDAPKLVQDAGGRKQLLMGGMLCPKPSGRGCGIGIAPHSRTPTATTGMRDPVQRLKDMDREEIDTAVIFGTTVFLSLPFLENHDLACAIARAYNDWLAQYCQANPRRLKGVALVPMQEPAEAVKELTRCVKELGFVAVATSAHSAGRNLDHPELYPFYAAAEQLGVPVCVHVGSGRPAAASERFDNPFFVHATTHTFEQMIGVMCVVGGGILERFPNLKFAFLEAGAGWIPYWMERLDEHYEYLQPTVPWLTKPPSDYMRSEQVYYSFEPDEHTLPFVMEFVGENRLVFASDYNHSDSKFPHTVEAVTKRRGLAQSSLRKVMGENAAKLYGI